MEIKVLGMGCIKCNSLEKTVHEVINELAIEATIEKVTDIKEIAKAGVMVPPGLMINGKIKLSGKVPSKAELTNIITTVLAES
ncbi:MAG: thioredoxin family protein [Desulfitobacteriaceae bacterium]|nr:thioredoxin family protein [Desulfitobacteriaceae bacterium]